MPTYNPTLLTVAQDASTSAPTVRNRTRVPMRVVDVILDETHPNFQNSNDIGAIKYQAIDSDAVEDNLENLPTAWPVDGTYRIYPLKNEIVFIESAPGPDQQVGSKTYYTHPINIWNNPHHNAYPDLRIYDGDLDLGENFTENGDIVPRTPQDGDILFEGRRGQSIRFTGNGTNTLITSGQTPSGSAQITVAENVNSDPSSIYMVNGQVPLSAASSIYDSYTSYIPSAPNSYTGNQVIINSGRLVFNSRTDHILLSSNLTISFNAIRGFNFDTPTNFVVGAGTSIRLGSATANHPLLKGDDTVDVLMELFDTLLSLTAGLVQGASQPNTTMPTVIEQGSATTYVLTNLKTRLEGLKSRKTYTD